MHAPKQILVLISGNEKKHEALERALEFAAIEDVHLHIFSVVYESISALEVIFNNDDREKTKQDFIADRYIYLDTIANDLEEKGIKCSARVEWNHSLHDAIEAVIEELKPDLVIKRIGTGKNNFNPFTTPVDRNLIRYSPAPVLLIKSDSWKTRPITLAIDPIAFDETHIELNNSILEYGKMLSQLTNNKLNIVSSFTIPSPSSTLDLPPVDYDLIRKNNKSSIETKLQALLKQHQLPLENIHVVEGSPNRALSDFIVKSGSQLLILGSVGRTGISAMFIGNTAEQILSEMSCEILAIKPVQK
jgi:universal stress protein E